MIFYRYYDVISLFGTAVTKVLIVCLDYIGSCDFAFGKSLHS